MGDQGAGVGGMPSVREHVSGVDGAVVVGTDGSDGATLAVRFAAEEARLRQVPLVALRSWNMTSAPTPPTEPGIVPPMGDYEAAVAAELRDQVVRALGGEDALAGLDLQVMPVHASPVKALLEATQHAALVVVGTRGHGALAGLLLGSTSEQVVTRAHGPVAVVRTPH